MTTLFTVETTKADGSIDWTYFQTLAGARKHAKWCRSQSYFTSVRIMAGGPGGYEVR